MTLHAVAVAETRGRGAFSRLLSDQLRAHPIAAFFGLAYGSSWLLLLVLRGFLGLPGALVILVQTIGPTLAALVMTRVVDGAAGPHDLLARIRIWRVGVRWYAFAALAIPGACVAAALAIPGGLAAIAGRSPVSLAVMFLVVAIVNSVSGPLFEEPGWRGYALPRMQAAWGPLRATLALGFLWAAWHLPQFLVPEWAEQNGGSSPAVLVEFLLLVVAITPVLSWVFNRTRGSLLLAMAVHASVNASLGVFVAADVALVTGVVAFGALSVVIVVATRGRLGCEPAAAPSAAAAVD